MKFNVRKFRKNMLTLFNWFMTALFVFSLLTLDSETWMSTISGFVSGFWLMGAVLIKILKEGAASDPS